MKRTAILYAPTERETGAAGCAGQPAMAGVEVVEVVSDDGGVVRSGLARALALIAGGAAEVLVVARLRDVASSLGELVALLAWLEQTGVDLIAADVWFDSRESGAGGTVAVLREVERWDREPHPARRPRGRPGLSSADPELAQRLALMRERGLSLQAIAAELNAERVPTARGGAEWRPSSVQAALGYRRPRRPAPAAPPLPRPSSARHAPPPGPRGPGPRQAPPPPAPPPRPGARP
ncbi:MAG: recombinase family protein [Solirubrobacteraceae bacterium]